MYISNKWLSKVCQELLQQKGRINNSIKRRFKELCAGKEEARPLAVLVRGSAGGAGLAWHLRTHCFHGAACVPPGTLSLLGCSAWDVHTFVSFVLNICLLGGWHFSSCAGFVACSVETPALGKTSKPGVLQAPSAVALPRWQCPLAVIIITVVELPLKQEVLQAGHLKSNTSPRHLTKEDKIVACSACHYMKKSIRY